MMARDAGDNRGKAVYGQSGLFHDVWRDRFWRRATLLFSLCEAVFVGVEHSYNHIGNQVAVNVQEPLNKA